MISLKDLSVCVLRPTLQYIGLYSYNAEILLAGTALVEGNVNGVTHLKQIGGPALGIFQMEPETHDDSWVNFLAYNHELGGKIRNLAQGVSPQIPPASQMAGNLYYATAMARVKYLRAPGAIPEAHDAAGLAQFHKKYYNTPLGAADELRNVKFFEDAHKELT